MRGLVWMWIVRVLGGKGWDDAEAEEEASLSSFGAAALEDIIDLLK